MKIESVDFFYLSMPQVRDIGDGSQDAALVRVRGGGLKGWGECEASPLTSIAAFVCPMSHSACKPVRDSVLGERLDSPLDIERISSAVHTHSLDLLQADHTFSGIEIALWDLLGKRLGEPVYRLLGYKHATPKLPYASQLFGDTPEETFEKAQRTRAQGFRAAKFGWGPYGHGDVETDRRYVEAARAGLGTIPMLMVDAGTVWGDDVEAAAKRLPALDANNVLWLEEPFVSGALAAYRELGAMTPTRLAGGEGAHNTHMALHMIDYAGVGFIQIDTGRIGGIGPAKLVADHASARGVTYVNHTFTTHLALSASLQPYAGLSEHRICEYPVEPSALARELAPNAIPIQPDGMVYLPDAPGLGVVPDPNAIRRHLVETTITVGGRTLYTTPRVD